MYEKKKNLPWNLTRYIYSYVMVKEEVQFQGQQQANVLFKKERKYSLLGIHLLRGVLCIYSSRNIFPCKTSSKYLKAYNVPAY